MYVRGATQVQGTADGLRERRELIKNEGAPTGVRDLQFYPARDGSGATCLWEADSVEDVQGYVDSTLGDSSENLWYEADAGQALARQPLGIPESAAIGA